MLILISTTHLLTYNSVGYYVDEIGAAYDAYCIANFGVDRWLNSFPLYFIAYGDGQNALLTYLIAFLFALTGNYSKFIIRLLPICFSLITAYYISQICSMKSDKHKITSLCLYAIMPAFTLLFQIGLESHLMLPLSAAFLYYFLKGISSKKRKYFVIGGILAGITLYTYALSYIVIPLFVIFSFTYCMIFKKTSGKNLVLFSFPLILLGLPLFAIQLINIFDLESVQIGVFTLPKLLTYRGSEITIKNFFQKLYWAFIHTNFYDGAPHNSIPFFGSIYYISIIFLIIGFVGNLRKIKESPQAAILIIWTLCMYIMAGLLKDESYTNITRLNALYLTKLTFVTDGLLIVLKKRKKANMKLLTMFIICVYSLLGMFFWGYYIVRYDIESESKLFREDYSDIPELDGEVYLPENYIYFLWSKKISPYDFNIGKNGYLRYKNYHIGYDELNYNGYYLVYKNDIISQENLENVGFKCEELTHYYLYSSTKSE